jgi:hypothetical protein
VTSEGAVLEEKKNGGGQFLTKKINYLNNNTLNFYLQQLH